MLKTNNKKARENVMNYIIDSASDYISESYELPADYKNICSSIRKIYELECRAPFSQNSFIRWGSGLACGSLFDYYCHSAVSILGDILEETEEERNRYSETEAENMLSYLIYREVAKRS